MFLSLLAIEFGWSSPRHPPALPGEYTGPGTAGPIFRASRMTVLLAVRLSEDGRVATWNPALTRARQVTLRVRGADGTLEERRSLNSGRARVRPGERIEAVLSAPDDQSPPATVA